MDKDFIEFCEIEDIEVNELNDKQIEKLKNTFSYNIFLLGKNFKDIFNIVFKKEH